MLELQPIEQIFVSSEIGYVKPDPRFFAAVQERLGVAPAEIMLVGDDELSDYAGAAEAGWRSVLVDRDGRGKTPGAIESLAKLL
jgi:HAD superfamily hydrolase (TIGR01509 family)